MKIIIDATTTQDQYSTRGIGRVTKEMVEGLLQYSKQQGGKDQFYLLMFNAPTSLESSLQEYASMVRTVNIGKKRLSGKMNWLWWRIQILPAIKKLIKSENPDVYYCPNFLRGIPGKYIPTVAMIYDFAFPVMGRYSTAPKFLDWIRKWQYHRALNRLAQAKSVISISEATRKDMYKYVAKVQEDRVKTIYLGLSEYFKKSEPNSDILRTYLPQGVIDRGYILYYGGIEMNKNVPGLIRSYKELLREWGNSDIRGDGKAEVPYLVLAGGDFTRLDMSHPVLAEIRDLIQKEQLEDHIVFTGYYEEEHAVHLLNGASLFVHLSLYEGFGFSPLEAMKCGVPVVASDRSCYPEILGDGALLVDPENEEEVAKACMKVLRDTSVAEQLSESGMKQAKKYTWSSTIKGIYTSLSEAIRSASDKEN